MRRMNAESTAPLEGKQSRKTDRGMFARAAISEIVISSHTRSPASSRRASTIALRGSLGGGVRAPPADRASVSFVGCSSANLASAPGHFRKIQDQSSARMGWFQAAPPVMPDRDEKRTAAG